MKAQSNATLLGRSLFATILGLFVAPLLWVMLMPLFGGGSDAILYAMASAILLCMAVYVGVFFLFQRWSR